MNFHSQLKTLVYFGSSLLFGYSSLSAQSIDERIEKLNKNHLSTWPCIEKTAISTLKGGLPILATPLLLLASQAEDPTDTILASLSFLYGLIGAEIGYQWAIQVESECYFDRNEALLTLWKEFYEEYSKLQSTEAFKECLDAWGFVETYPGKIGSYQLWTALYESIGKLTLENTLYFPFIVEIARRAPHLIHQKVASLQFKLSNGEVSLYALTAADLALILSDETASSLFSEVKAYPSSEILNLLDTNILKACLEKQSQEALAEYLDSIGLVFNSTVVPDKVWSFLYQNLAQYAMRERQYVTQLFEIAKRNPALLSQEIDCSHLSDKEKKPEHYLKIAGAIREIQDSKNEQINRLNKEIALLLWQSFVKCYQKEPNTPFM